MDVMGAIMPLSSIRYAFVSYRRTWPEIHHNPPGLKSPEYSTYRAS